MSAWRTPHIVGNSSSTPLLSQCVGYEIPEDTVYDPMAGLAQLVRNYPGCGLYLSMLGYKTQLPHLREIWS